MADGICCPPCEREGVVLSLRTDALCTSMSARRYPSPMHELKQRQAARAPRAAGPLLRSRSKHGERCTHPRWTRAPRVAAGRVELALCLRSSVFRRRPMVEAPHYTCNRVCVPHSRTLTPPMDDGSARARCGPPALQSRDCT